MMNKNEYRRAFIMLRPAMSGYSGHVRLERRTMTGSMYFIVAAQTGGLNAALVGQRGGEYYAAPLGTLRRDAREQLTLAWAFDPRHIDGRPFEAYQLIAVAQTEGGDCRVVLTGNVDGAYPMDAAAVREAVCALYRSAQPASDLPAPGEAPAVGMSAPNAPTPAAETAVPDPVVVVGAEKTVPDPIVAVGAETATEAMVLPVSPVASAPTAEPVPAPMIVCTVPAETPERPATTSEAASPSRPAPRAGSPRRAGARVRPDAHLHPHAVKDTQTGARPGGDKQRHPAGERARRPAARRAPDRRAAPGGRLYLHAHAAARRRRFALVPAGGAHGGRQHRLDVLRHARNLRPRPARGPAGLRLGQRRGAERVLGLHLRAVDDEVRTK